MAQHLVVVGSGASAVHFALSVLEKGHKVTMIDVGHAPPQPVSPGLTFNELKTKLDDPVGYFLGRRYEGVVHADGDGEYYGFPPSKTYVFTPPDDDIDLNTTGFEPLRSFAQGGLAQTWTGGSYPLNDAELADYPFSYKDLQPYYEQVARRVGISGDDDDLSRFFPTHDHLLPGLELDEHSQLLADTYRNAKHKLNNGFHAYLGRSRIATLSRDQDNRKACSYTGRCLWGCPSQSLYTPSISLGQCNNHPNFTYMSRVYASHFVYDDHKQIKHLVARSLADGQVIEVKGDSFILAAGTLCSSYIFMASLLHGEGRLVRLPGLMDNRQLLVPFLNLAMIGKPFQPDSYQYHQLAMGIETPDPKHYVHCQITTLKTALAQPIITSMPLNLRTASFLFRNLRSGLGILNINLHDTRRDDNFLTLDGGSRSDQPRLAINYTPPHDEPQRLKRTLHTVKKCLWQLGCVVPPGMTYTRPMGASVHYAGTIPMSDNPAPLTASPTCRSNDLGNLYFVDGTTLPFLPAKNLTFTLMANAARVADQAF